VTDLRQDNLIERTAVKTGLPEALVRKVVNSFFLDGFRHYTVRPYAAKGHIDLTPFFQVRISIPKLRYLLSYKTLPKRLVVICGELYKLLKENGKRQTGFKNEHERLVELAYQRTREAIQDRTFTGAEQHNRELSLRQQFPGKIDEIQRKYFASKSEVCTTQTEI